MVTLVPGVSTDSGFSYDKKGVNGGADISVSGAPSNGNLWLVDGANNVDVGSNRTILVYPSLDSIEEFKIVRNSYGAQFGGAGGGIVSIVSKSGTNAFHALGSSTGYLFEELLEPRPRKPSSYRCILDGSLRSSSRKSCQGAPDTV